MTAPALTSSTAHPRSTTLFRLSAVAAITAGLIFAGIQPIHPPDVLASVTTGTWAIILSFKLAMCLAMMIGITGLYLHQAERAGWLGFAGFAMLVMSWFLTTGFVFTETLVLPPLAVAAPEFIDSVLGIVNGAPGTMDIGALPIVYGVVGVFYLLGGIVFGIATFRAGVLPKWPAGLLAVTALVTPAAALLPHHIQRYVAIPMGIALIWLGIALWLSAGKRASDASATTTQLRSVAAE